MGYESKIFIVNRYSDEYSEIIAEYNLSKMGNNFYYAIPKLFENEFDSLIYAENRDESVNIDRYDDKIRSTKEIDRLADYLENMNDRKYYCRLNPLIGLLRNLKSDDWEDLQILHYGY